MATDQWDEALRGKKMSNPEGKTLYKYQMPVLEKFTLELPRGAQILRVADQGGMFWLWALVDIREPDETRHFRAFKCGAPIPDEVDFDSLTYLGWAAIFVQQELALYIFEEKIAPSLDYIVSEENNSITYRSFVIRRDEAMAFYLIIDPNDGRYLHGTYETVDAAKEYIDSIIPVKDPE